MRNRAVLILALLGGAAELACTGTVSGALIGDDAGVGGVVVSVSPQASSVLPQGTAAFTANITGTTTGQSTAVTWSVQESGGGTVDGTGHYTAPAAAGCTPTSQRPASARRRCTWCNPRLRPGRPRRGRT